MEIDEKDLGRRRIDSTDAILAEIRRPKTIKKMEEIERNKRLILLLSDLKQKEDYASIELIKTLIEKDSPSMKKSFEIMTRDIRNELHAS